MCFWILKTPQAKDIQLHSHFFPHRFLFFEELKHLRKESSQDSVCAPRLVVVLDVLDDLPQAADDRQDREDPGRRRRELRRGGVVVGLL